jgi:hypothetical protein
MPEKKFSCKLHFDRLGNIDSSVLKNRVRIWSPILPTVKKPDPKFSLLYLCLTKAYQFGFTRGLLKTSYVERQQNQALNYYVR